MGDLRTYRPELPQLGARVFFIPHFFDESTIKEAPDRLPEKAWEEIAKNILRAEMMRHGVSYAGLADRLGALGVTDNELNLRNKVSRGRFTAVFLIQCLRALDAEWIHLPASLDEAAGKGAAQVLARKSKTFSA